MEVKWDLETDSVQRVRERKASRKPGCDGERLGLVGGSIDKLRVGHGDSEMPSSLILTLQVIAYRLGNMALSA